MKRFTNSLALVLLLAAAGVAWGEDSPSGDDATAVRRSLLNVGFATNQDKDGKSESLLGDKKANGDNGEKKNNGKGEEKKHISDNSFFVEEAYNQEAGVAQHIFNWVGTWDREAGSRRRDFNFLYTIELPIGSQDHQFSFTPMVFQNFSERPAGGVNEEQGGFGDLYLNYRYQFWMEDEHGWRPAVAPRFTLILPTGDEQRGLGTGTLGYQFNLPISKQMEPIAVHWNAGCTYYPDASATLPTGFASPKTNLRNYNLGASVIWLASYELNFLVEFVAQFNEGIDELGFRDHSTVVFVNPGFRYAIYTDDSVQWVVGASVPIGLSKDAPDIGVFGYLSVEHSFKKKKNGNGD